MIVTAARASAILFQLVRARRERRPLLVPANVCPVVPLAIRHAGGEVELVDLEEPALTLDRAECLRRLRARPGAYGGVIFVHPYGAETDAASFLAELRRLGEDLLLLDDRCLCPPQPAATDAVPAADAVLWSTGPRKCVDLGGGGFARLSPGVAYAASSRPFAPAAWEAAERGVKSALAERRPFPAPTTPWLDLGPAPWPWESYRAAIMTEAPRADALRRRLNAIYTAGIPPSAQFAAEFQHWRFQILVTEPDRLIASLAAAGLFAGRHFASLGGVLTPQSCPVAERLHARVVNLFNDANFDEERAQRTAAVVRAHLGAGPGR